MEFKLKQESKSVLFIFILALALYISYLARSLITSILTAILLSIICYPLYNKILGRIKSPRLSSFITVIILCIVVIIPLILVIFGLVSEGLGMYNNITGDSSEKMLSNLKSATSGIASYFNIPVDDSLIVNLISTIVSKVKAGFWSALQYVSSVLVLTIIQVLFTLVFMYYFFIHGKKIYKFCEAFLPMSETHKILLAKEIKKDINVLFLGQGLIALIQGFAGYVGFLIFGVPNALFLGFVMVILSFFPIVGAFLVWVPVGLSLLIAGDSFAGWGVLIWGAVIVSYIDNLVRPFIVSSVSEMNFLAVLVGVYIGVIAFGIIGVVLGPLIIAITYSVIKIYYDEHVAERTINEP